MLCSAIKKYLNFYGVKCGNKIVIFTNNDSAYETAIDLHHKGIKIEAIVDTRENSLGDLPKRSNQLGIKNYWKYTIISSAGYSKVKRVSIMKLSKDNSSVTGEKINLDCDSLGMSGGWTPVVHLFTQSGEN